MDYRKILEQLELATRAQVGNWAFEVEKDNPATFRFICEEGKLIFSESEGRRKVRVEFMDYINEFLITDKYEIDRFTESLATLLQGRFIKKVRKDLVKEFPFIKEHYIMNEMIYYDKRKELADIYFIYRIGPKCIKIRYQCDKKRVRFKEASYTSGDLSEIVELVTALSLYDRITDS